LDIAGRNLGYKIIAANTTSAGGGMFELDYRLGETWTLANGAEYSVARANERFNWIKDNLWQSADVVVVAVAPDYFLGMDTNPETSPEAPAKLATTLQELLLTTGRKPILIQGIPPIKDYGDQTIYIDKVDKVLTGIEEQMDRVYTKLRDTGASNIFEYLEVSRLFLDDEGLSHTQIGGVPVYYNQVHINTLYAASAGDYFTEQLRILIDE
jgi:hypothetical protein